MSRSRLAVAMAIVVPLGLATKLVDADWVRGSFGGVFYVMFWVLAALFVRRDLPPRRVAVVVLLLTCGIELLQLWHPPPLERVRANPLGGILLGSTFDPFDFLYYVVGAAVGVAVAELCRA